MPDFGNSRRKLKVAIGVMLAVDVVAVAVLFSPLVGSADSRQLQLNQLRGELYKKTRQVEPLIGVDRKIVLAKDQIGGGYKEHISPEKYVFRKYTGEWGGGNKGWEKEEERKNTSR